jgi:hypothetical protein
MELCLIIFEFLKKMCWSSLNSWPMKRPEGIIIRAKEMARTPAKMALSPGSPHDEEKNNAKKRRSASASPDFRTLA